MSKTSPSGREPAARTSARKTGVKKPTKVASVRAVAVPKTKTKPRNARGGIPTTLKIYALAGGGALLLIIIALAWNPVQRARLLARLRNGDTAERARAGNELAGIGSPVVAPLGAALADSGWSEEARLGAAQALVRMNLAAADAELARLAICPDAALRRLALTALADYDDSGQRFPAEIYVKNAGGEPPVRRLAAVALGKYRGAEVVAALVGLCKDPDQEIQLSALKSLSLAASPADVGVILPLLDENSPLLRQNITRILARHASDSALTVLREAYAHSTAPRQAALIEVFGYLYTAESLKPLVRQALDSPAAEVRAEAFKAAGRMRLDDVYNRMVAALKDDSPQVRIGALLGVQATHDQELGVKMRPALTDPDPAVRQAAMVTTYACNDEAAAPILAQLLSDADAKVAAGAMKILSGFFPRQARQFGDKIDRWQAWAAGQAKEDSVLDQLDQLLKQAQEMIGQADPAQRKLAAEQLDAALKELTAREEADQLPKEYKEKGSPVAQRFKLLRDKLRQLHYTAMKMQNAVEPKEAAEPKE